MKRPRIPVPSRPGDPCRQGRAVRDQVGIVAFDDRDGRVYALLGIMIVGEITINPAGRSEYLWSCFLPMTPRMQRAANLDKAKSAVDFKVREWCEAAGLVVSESALRKLRGGR